MGDIKPWKSNRPAFLVGWWVYELHSFFLARVDVIIQNGSPAFLAKTTTSSHGLKLHFFVVFLKGTGRAIPDEKEETLLESDRKRPLKIGRAPKGKESSSNHQFSGAFAVSFRECIQMRR